MESVTDWARAVVAPMSRSPYTLVFALWPRVLLRMRRHLTVVAGWVGSVQFRNRQDDATGAWKRDPYSVARITFSPLRVPPKKIVLITVSTLEVRELGCLESLKTLVGRTIIHETRVP